MERVNIKEEKGRMNRSDSEWAGCIWQDSSMLAGGGGRMATEGRKGEEMRVDKIVLIMQLNLSLVYSSYIS